MFRRLTVQQGRGPVRRVRVGSSGRALFTIQLWLLVAMLAASFAAGVRQLMEASQESQRAAEPAPITVAEPLKLVSESEDY